MTQIEKAKYGKTTKIMIEAAKNENMSAEDIRLGIVSGKIVIPKNNKKKLDRILAIGEGTRIKVNANIGTSNGTSCLNSELEKVDIALENGADAIMDLSTAGDLKAIRDSIIERSSVMTGSVPIYSLMSKLNERGKDISKLTSEDFLNELVEHLDSGMDFITVHAGVTKFVVDMLEESDRILGIVSRGGALIKKWMQITGNENPFYSNWDRVLDIFYKYDAVISLGDGLRPGSIEDATDRAQITELAVLGDLAKKARAKGIQVMIEGPGHLPYSEIKGNMDIMKKLCDNAPIYILGPLPTDISSGYDHITGAIGGAAAAVHGADFLCYLTPAEHLCLPEKEDVKQGVIASRIAAHIGNLERKIYSNQTPDKKISEARKKLNWEEIINNSIDPELSETRRGNIEEECSMCGGLCAIKNSE